MGGVSALTSTLLLSPTATCSNSPINSDSHFHFTPFQTSFSAGYPAPASNLKSTTPVFISLPIQLGKSPQASPLALPNTQIRAVHVCKLPLWLTAHKHKDRYPGGQGLAVDSDCIPLVVGVSEFDRGNWSREAYASFFPTPLKKKKIEIKKPAAAHTHSAWAECWHRVVAPRGQVLAPTGSSWLVWQGVDAQWYSMCTGILDRVWNMSYTNWKEKQIVMHKYNVPKYELEKHTLWNPHSHPAPTIKKWMEGRDHNDSNNLHCL